MINVMYALCPECNNRVVDHGRGGRLRCPVCHTVFPSRPMPDKFRGQSAPRDPGGPVIDRRSEHYYYIQYGEPIVSQPSADAGTPVDSAGCAAAWFPWLLWAAVMLVDLQETLA